MSLFKGKKKKAYTKKNNHTIQTTIDSRHTNKINQLLERRNILNEKKEELDKMQKILNNYTKVLRIHYSEKELDE